MVEGVLVLMSYLMHSPVWFASWGCAKRIDQPLVLLHCLVCNLMVERQILSVPCEFSFLGYYSFVESRRFSIGLQGIHDLLPRIIRTCWKFIWVMTISPSTTSSLATTYTTTDKTISYTHVSSAAPESNPATASGIELWTLRMLGDSRSSWIN